MKALIDGEEQEIPTEFVSLEIFYAIQENNKWISERYCLVEIGDLFPAWITSEEQVTLREMETLDEIEEFVKGICLKPVSAEDFRRWQQNDA